MLNARVYSQEEMDNFNMQGPILNDSLHSLSLINKLLGNTSTTLTAVKKILMQHPKKVFHIVDLGCGGGDNLRAIAKWCFQNTRRVQLTGIDGNSHILEYAKQQESSLEINYCQADILDVEFEIEPCDILISSHFIYRFADDELVSFIQKSTKKVNSSIIFNELQRNVIPYFTFRIFGRLLFFNNMTIQDGLKAIKSSFKKKELQHILKQLTVKSYELKRKWAFRYLIIIKV